MAINWITAQGILLKDYEEAPVNNIFIQVEPTTSIIKKNSRRISIKYGFSLC